MGVTIVRMQSGETDIQKLLAGANPEMDPAVYVFCLLPGTAPLPDSYLGVFREDEGVTVIVNQADAARLGLEGVFPCRRITMKIHSALETVGFLAKISARLAETGIPANTVSGYYHDHLFVPMDKAELAMRVLQTLS